jgi:hypothetical protein
VKGYRTDFTLKRIGRGHARSFAETLCAGYGMPEEWVPSMKGSWAGRVVALHGDGQRHAGGDRFLVP